MHDAVEVVNKGIAKLAETWIAKGARPKRAVEVATTAVLDKLAAERPDILEKYIAGLLARGADAQ
ncbi:hypothetical protein [Actinoplanes philippinensis]|uniref:hypothetical protein n=1 Tax=Actinoplanes philippinensis TaxID=35752 RepID=UPI0033C6722F